MLSAWARQESTGCLQIQALGIGQVYLRKFDVTCMTVFQKLRDKIRYGTFPYYLQGRLTSLGLTICPYYLEIESLLPAADLGVSIQPRLSPRSTSFKTEQEIYAIYEHPERDASNQKYKIPARISDGCLCFGVNSQEETVAFTWCDLKQCNHAPLKFLLQEHEAYLFDMYTFKEYRGRNIAPYIRYQLYQALTERGQTTYYSVTDALNTPSVRFKRKLGAKHAELYLYIKLWGLFERNLKLKTFQTATS